MTGRVCIRERPSRLGEYGLRYLENGSVDRRRVDVCACKGNRGRNVEGLKLAMSVSSLKLGVGPQL